MPEDLRDRLRSRFPHLAESDLQRAEGGGEGSLLAFLEEQGMGHGEALQHFQEFMETAGDTVAPTIDPPSHTSPDGGENTDNPR